MAFLAGTGAVLLGMVRGRMTRFEIADRSMEPALHPGDYVVCTRLRGVPQRGQIVVFPHPDRPDLNLVKRVIGLPGEKVELRGGEVGIDGGVLAEPWAATATTGERRWELGPAGVLVLGDNRAESAYDGRDLGPLAAGALPWRVVLRYWPPSRFGMVS